MDSNAPWVAALGEVAGALATFAAVVVALVLASRDDRRRHRENLDRATAQARLVLAGDTGTRAVGEGGPPFKHELTIFFANYSNRPVLDVYAKAWPSDHSLIEAPAWAVHSRIVHPGQDHPMVMKVTTPSAQYGLAAWRVRWTDGDGREWCVDQPRQHRPLPLSGQAPRILLTTERPRPRAGAQDGLEKGHGRYYSRRHWSAYRDRAV